MHRLISLAVLVALICCGLVESLEISLCLEKGDGVKIQSIRDETNKLLNKLGSANCERLLCVLDELNLVEQYTHKLKLKEVQDDLKSSNPPTTSDQIEKCVKEQHDFIDARTSWNFLENCKSLATAYKCLGIDKNDYLDTQSGKKSSKIREESLET